MIKKRSSKLVRHIIMVDDSQRVPLQSISGLDMHVFIKSFSIYTIKKMSLCCKKSAHFFIDS